MKKLGLALGAGGSRGVAHIGFLKALEEVLDSPTKGRVMLFSFVHPKKAFTPIVSTESGRVTSSRATQLEKA